MIAVSKYVTKYKNWKTKRFLDKHGCTTQKQYDRLTDPDVFHHADKINHFYHGYSHVYCCERDDHPVYNFGADFSIGIEEVTRWAENNLKHKWRYDGHRVMHQTGIGIDGSTEREWWFNDIAGGDYYFFAFTDERDYMMFLLRWA